MSNSQNTDEWSNILDIKLKELKDCQDSKQFDTCTKCNEFFECAIRKSYIKSVYESMNKGSDGGFEF